MTETEARQAAEREFARFDTNRDDTISRDEFTMDIEASAEPGKQARDARTFARADCNSDGRIDRAEFGLSAQESYEASGGQAEGVLDSPYAKAALQDGEIDIERLAAHTAQVFYLLDTDRDFALTEAEWSAPAETARLKTLAAELFDETGTAR